MDMMRENTYLPHKNITYSKYSSGGGSNLHTSDKKAVSTLAMILLIIVSAVLGGLITYLFTVGAFVLVPGSTVTINNIYFDKQNAESFKIEVLNPSFSSANVTLNRIAIAIGANPTLYDVITTDPSIENGTVISKGTIMNVTCYRILKDGINTTWGEIVGNFPGQDVTINIFAPPFPASNFVVTLPYVKLEVTETDFDSEFSFEKFNITINNNPSSEIDLEVTDIAVSGTSLSRTDITPQPPEEIAINTSILFMCNADWHSLANSTIKIFTAEGYVYSKFVSLSTTDAAVQNAVFDVNNTDYFDVTVFNSPTSSKFVNVTRIVAILDNGTNINQTYSPIGIIPNSTATLRVDWPWKQYRERTITVAAFFLQDFQTVGFSTTTPPAIIIKVLNEDQAFSLTDKQHFNITLQNHESSVDAINVTYILVKETGQKINGTNSEPPMPYGPISPGQSASLYGNITDWSSRAGTNLTIAVVILTNTTSTSHTFEFIFRLPLAELRITNVTHFETNYLNITVQNPSQSVGNLTISAVNITLQNQTQLQPQTFTPDQITVAPGGESFLICAFDWQQHLGENIKITVATAQGVQTTTEVTV